VEENVRITLQLTVAVCLVSLSMAARTAAQEVKPATAPTAAASPTSMEEVLQTVRTALQNDRADIIAKNLSLTSEQAAKFWPMFASYQKEQSAIMDEQLKGLQQYVENFDTLDDATALTLINSHFERDSKMNALRQKWLVDFQKVLGTKLAVRAMQIDRRISLVQQLQFASKIPLVQ
jgi:Spy/CpxP family protein refolding chaperone